MVNFEKDENENLKAKFLTANASFLIPLKEAENHFSISCVVCATEQSQ